MAHTQHGNPLPPPPPPDPPLLHPPSFMHQKTLLTLLIIIIIGISAAEEEGSDTSVRCGLFAVYGHPPQHVVKDARLAPALRRGREGRTPTLLTSDLAAPLANTQHWRPLGRALAARRRFAIPVLLDAVGGCH